MQSGRLSFFKSLKGRILLGVSLAFVVILVGLIVIASSNMQDQQVALASRVVLSSVQKAAKEVHGFNQSAVSSAKMLALSQTSGLYPNREVSLYNLKESMEQSPEFVGAYMIYEPKHDKKLQGQKLKAVEGTEASPASFTLFAPYWQRGEKRSGELELNELKVDDKLVYQEIIDNVMSGKKELFAISEPFKRGQDTIVESAYPIMMEGEFVGIVGFDQSISRVKEQLAKIKPFETTDFILLSRSGTIISNSLNESLDGRRQNDTSYSDAISHFFHEKRQTEAVTRFLDKLNKKNYYYAAAAIPMSDWLVVMRVEEGEILGPVNAAFAKWLSLALGATIIVLVFLFFLARSLTEAIGRAQRITHEVSSGNLLVEIIGGRDDEVGLLVESLGGMNENLLDLICKVKRSAEEITKTADNIEAHTEGEKDKFNNFLELTNEIVSTVKGISTTSMGLVKTMKEINEAATETTELADSGRTGLINMEEAMHKLQDSTTTIASKLAVLNDKANNINSVVTTINKVADQTNLLSLNAAIEAEKAGEQGLGFAVVATEIRRLADQTAIATLDIEQMVKEVQEAVSSGVLGMENFSKEVKRSIEDVGSLSKRLSRIIEQVKALINRFDSVRGGVDEQVQGAQEVSQFINKLSRSVEDTATSLQEFHLSTKSLKNYTEVLQDEVAYFKTSNTAKTPE